jgi:two-component system sensor histidine kinase/response regulator
MLNYHSSILNRTLSGAVVEQLCFLWQNMADLAGETALLITEEMIEEEQILGLNLSNNLTDERFRLLISPEIQALLFASKHQDQTSYQVSLTFKNEVIRDFLNQLIHPLENYPELQALLLSVDQVNTNQEQEIYHQFIMDLLEILVKNNVFDSSELTAFPRFFAYQPIDVILHNRLEQERILNQMTLQISQNQDLLIILQITLEQVSNLLKIDRLVIYQLNVKLTDETGKTQATDLVTFEAKTSDHINSLLHFRDETCFSDYEECRSKYRQGFSLIVDDIANSNLNPCLKLLMEKLEVKAKIVTPILVQDQLWGFLIAHQCHHTRNWQPNEVKFITNVAQYLAIAIYQSESYHQLQEQQKILEQQIEKRATELRDALLAAEAASQSKSEFIGNMSHELRTPLTCVIGLSSTLLKWSLNEKNAPLPLEKQQQYLQNIQDSGKKLLELINNILEFSQVEAGKSVLDIKEFSLKNISFFLIKNLKQEAEVHQINLKLELIIEENQDIFYGDSKRIKQILLNLLSNAIKFTPVHGTVILRVWREKNYAIFQIEDTGIGISKNQLPLLFGKFQQLESSRQKSYGGTGLGLALTKQLIELHGGKIEVESTIDQGSIFTVWLPSLSNYLSKNKHKSDYQDTPPGQTIVLITKNDEIATLICEMLTVAKYQVIWLIDTSIPVKQIKIIQPCLIIVDTNFSDLNYDQLISELKELQNVSNLKILILTDQLTAEIWSLYADAGVHDYLLLPIQPQSLLQKVNSLLFNNINPS